MIPALLVLCFTAYGALAGPVVTEEAICNLCSDAVRDLEAAVSDQQVHARVMVKLEEVCDLISPHRREECGFVLSGLGQEVLGHLLQDMEPVHLCVAMTACPAPAAVYTQKASRTVQPVDADDDVCDSCEAVVKAIDTVLRNKANPAKANSTVLMFCEALPAKLRNTCLTIFPLLVDMLEQGVDPAGTCTNLNYCQTESEPAIQTNHPLASGEQAELPSDTPVCELCELLVQTVDQYLEKNSTKAAINATVYKLCNDLPDPIKSTCLGLAPLVVNALSSGVDPKVACTAVKLCDSTDDHKTSPEVKRVSDGPACELCELLVQAVDQYLKENSTEAAINATVYKLCNDLPDSIKSTCLGLAPLVVTTLSNGVDPKQACTAVKLCNSSDGHNTPSKVKRVSDGPACELCELLVQAVDQYLQENSTEATINATVYKLCNDLPDSIKSTCLGLAPLVVTTLSNGVDPKQACTAVKLCDSSDDHFTPPQVKRVSDGPACELCELLVQAVDQYLKENSTEAAINATVYKLCNDLPDSIKSTCLGLAPLVVTTLSNGVDPKQACTAVKLCDSTDKQILVQETKRVSDGPACELCELLVQAVDQYLKENSTEAAINATVYKLCNDLPDSVKATCLGLAPLVVTTLSNGVDPKQACTAVKLCDSSDYRIPSHIAKRLSDGPACELCELLIQTVDQYLKENKTEAAINATIYNLCNDLPNSVKTTCLLLAPLLVGELSQGVDPQQACTALKLCQSIDIPISPPIAMDLSVTPVCELCELLVQTVDQYLEENSTEAAINATLYKLCNDLPDSIKSACFSFIPEVMRVLSNGVDPQTACSTLGLCDFSEAAAEGTVVESPHAALTLFKDAVMPELHIDWCTVCKDHIGIIDLDLIKEEATLNNFLDGICHRLPPPTDKACLTAVDTKFPQIWESFLNGTASAENVCKLLEACPK